MGHHRSTHHEAVLETARTSRRLQGLPEHIEDHHTLARIYQLLATGRDAPEPEQAECAVCGEVIDGEAVPVANGEHAHDDPTACSDYDICDEPIVDGEPVMLTVAGWRHIHQTTRAQRRQLVAEYVAGGVTQTELAKRYGISRPSVHRLLARRGVLRKCGESAEGSSS